MSQPELALALVGFGRVGRRFVRLLEEVQERLDFDWRLVAVATHHQSEDLVNRIFNPLICNRRSICDLQSQDLRF